MFTEPDPESSIGLTGARFGGVRQPEPEPEPEPAPRVESDFDWVPRLESDEPARSEIEEWAHRPESHALVRPYAWTGGRTRATTQLAIEALVRATGMIPGWEHQTITTLCATPRSVAEVAALLNLPLGVARVLISDLADHGFVEVDRRVGHAPDLVMLRRVLAGLRNL